MEISQLLELITTGTMETIGMILISTGMSYLLGIPVGIILYITAQDGLCENKLINTILGTVVNFLRAVPFIILLIAIMPFTRIVVGTTIGMKAITDCRWSYYGHNHSRIYSHGRFRRWWWTRSHCSAIWILQTQQRINGYYCHILSGIGTDYPSNRHTYCKEYR